jgi:hypothetical protein
MLCSKQYQYNMYRNDRVYRYGILYFVLQYINRTLSIRKMARYSISITIGCIDVVYRTRILNKNKLGIDGHDRVYRAQIQYSITINEQTEQNERRHSMCTYYEEEDVHDAVYRARIRLKRVW